ncbi:Ger(x)C family spore germination protein [Paenibacillus antarcticus]|uniref:Spore gernimation protein GerC n=1 Tax=Paenibacillus antarcticus TaxID=253703 RepID=A0A168JAM9_9BACL|nr:Ger(x)C family spore germination protein [Paenibacillus antarcticus]OAB40366.1 spore gernimation protein GerC [Paenibacillus antarcticus]
MKNRRIIVVLLQLTVFSLLLTGCWDSLEIDNRSLILGIAIDEAGPDAAKEEDLTNHKKLDSPDLNANMIRLTAQIAVAGRIPLGPGSGGDSENSAKGKNSPVWVVEVLGHTIDDAMNNLQQEIADPRFLIHLRVIVVSKKIAEKGLVNLNDYLRRNPEVRRSTWLLVADKQAADFMNVAPPLERVPTLYLLSMIEKSIAMGKFPQAFLSTFWSNDSKLGQSAYLPYVSIRQGQNVLIKGLAYFKDNKLAGTTTYPMEIGVFMAAKGINPGGFTTLFPVKDIGYVMVRTTNRKSHISIQIKNGKPHANVYVRLQSELGEKYDEQSKIDSEKSLKTIELEQERWIANVIHDLIKKTQKDKSDIFGFGEYVRAHERSFWNKSIQEKRDWENMYADMSVTIKVKVNIRRVGMKIY